MTEPFELFGPTHQMIILATFLLPLLLISAKRILNSEFFNTFVLYSIAFVLFINRLWAVAIAWQAGMQRATDYLPLQLCDVATFMVIVACITRHSELIRVTYFFSLAGTLQAILTPDIRSSFPEPRFISFFVSHCGVVVAAIYLTFGLGVHPKWNSVIYAFFWLQVYAVTAFITNLIFGTNFGYLAHKPLNPSILDFFGPWPWYIFVLEVVALAKFIVLLTPFLVLKIIRHKFTGWGYFIGTCQRNRRS